MPRRTFTECVFCGASPPLTKEHVWPRWLREVMLSSHKLPHRHTTTVAGEPDKTWAAPPFSMQLKAVCATCNNGWMSSMEVTARPLLVPMIGGQPTSLTLEQQRVVSRWVAKTAMVFQLTTAHNSIRPHQYRSLQLHLIPPPGNQVWLAARTADEPVPASFGIRTSDLRNPADGREFHSYLATIAMGHFVAQLFGNDLPFDLEWTRRGQFDDALIPIYPERERVTWPPRLLRSFAPLAEDPEFEAEIGRGLGARGQEVRHGRSRRSAAPGHRAY